MIYLKDGNKSSRKSTRMMKIDHIMTDRQSLLTA